MKEHMYAIFLSKLLNELHEDTKRIYFNGRKGGAGDDDIVSMDEFNEAVRKINRILDKYANQIEIFQKLVPYMEEP